MCSELLFEVGVHQRLVHRQRHDPGVVQDEYYDDIHGHRIARLYLQSRRPGPKIGLTLAHINCKNQLNLCRLHGFVLDMGKNPTILILSEGWVSTKAQ